MTTKTPPRDDDNDVYDADEVNPLMSEESFTIPINVDSVFMATYRILVNEEFDEVAVDAENNIPELASWLNRILSTEQLSVLSRELDLILADAPADSGVSQ